jgi:hypothetical protein
MNAQELAQQLKADAEDGNSHTGQNADALRAEAEAKKQQPRPN